jgi:hypothetical protein
MGSLRQRIEDIVLNSLTAHRIYFGFWVQGLIDRIMVEIGDEFARRKAEKAASNESDKELRLPL